MFLSERRILEQFEDFFHEVFFSNYSIQNGPYTDYTNICYNIILAQSRSVCYNEGIMGMFCYQKLDYYDVELHFQIIQYHSLSGILDRYKNMKEADLVLKLGEGEDAYRYHIKPQTFENIDHEIGVSMQQNVTSYKNNCSRKAERIVLSQQSECAFIELKLTDYDWVTEGNRFYLNSSRYVALNETQFKFGPNKTSILVCSGVYRNIFPVMDTLTKIEGPETFDFANIVSVLCVSASLLCLLTALVTFCVFSSLRSLPGKNNMSLSGTLFGAQTSYLIGSYGQFEQDAVVCIIVGLFTHFLWLMSIFWMNVCTFHVFRVFIGTRNISTGRGVKTFLIYWSYVIIVSAALVLVNMLISLL